MTGGRHPAGAMGFTVGRFEAAAEPGRRSWRTLSADRRCTRGTTVQKLRLDAGCLHILHGAIEHLRAAPRFSELRIGVPRRWAKPKGFAKRKAPPVRAGLRETSTGVLSVPKSDTTPICLCPSPCRRPGTPAATGQVGQWGRWFLRAVPAASCGPSPEDRCGAALGSSPSAAGVGIVVVGSCGVEGAPLDPGGLETACDGALRNLEPIPHRVASRRFALPPPRWH